MSFIQLRPASSSYSLAMIYLAHAEAAWYTPLYLLFFTTCHQEIDQNIDFPQGGDMEQSDQIGTVHQKPLTYMMI